MSTLAPIHARPDTTALLLSHAALRGEFARLAEACRAPGAEALRAGITDHLALVLDVLRLLHEAEEDVLWPALSGAAPCLRPELGALAAERASLAVPLARVRVASAGPPDRLADRLREAGEAVAAYLTVKEGLCLEGIRAFLPMSAWERFEETRRWRIPPSLRSRVEGLLLSYGSPEQLAHLRATGGRLQSYLAFRRTLPAHHRRMRAVYGHLPAGGVR
ncbi:hypothetical protein GCM10018790_37950 [Kitasatospora xanthocidica]|uniref:hemerythrin domain-containing protein n=1 Tax=Kitasatospora xanthocidica TaxID=83382 RepID=UPI0016773819|nr:hemerythrin domain-containing protein [Kitasatospora xanthocidica]GHF56367.1 hypothetical protein GCM10018790_37950 [Kitasatospora xanthocidica]